MAINFNANPWDKIGHALLGLLISTPFFLASLLKDSAVWAITLPLIGVALSIGIFYGREQFGFWKAGKDAYPAGDLGFIIKSWLFWHWTRDGILDWLVLWPVHGLQLLAWWYLIMPVPSG